MVEAPTLADTGEAGDEQGGLPSASCLYEDAIGQALRTESYKYLNKNNVISLLDTEAFLMPV